MVGDILTGIKYLYTNIKHVSATWPNVKDQIEIIDDNGVSKKSGRAEVFRCGSSNPRQVCIENLLVIE